MSAQCQRTKNWSLGVNTDLSKTSIGVSSKGGWTRWRIMLPLPGKALVIGRSALPPGSFRSTSCCASAGAAARPAVPSAAWLRKRRRLVSLSSPASKLSMTRLSCGQPRWRIEGAFRK